ncbi:MAG: hypothetical protein KDA60_16235 [Planctomycetales bacterium]|nr:hypothetical protein [Planctomycetales bacterium]
MTRHAPSLAALPGRCLVDTCGTPAPCVLLLFSLVGWSLLCCSFLATAHAQTYFDNFDDGNPLDGQPVSWNINPGGFFPGTYDASSGDYFLYPTDQENDDETLVSWVQTRQYQEVGSVRSRAQVFVDETGFFTGSGNVGVMMFFNPATVSGYLGVVDHAGNAYILSAVGGEVTELVATQLDFDATQTVNMQLDVDGTNVSYSIWPKLARQPETPQLTVDTTQIDPALRFTSGSSGIVFNEDDPNDLGIFHYVAASPHRIQDGDLDLDGIVGASDIDILFQNLGNDVLPYDIHEDGDTTMDDVDFLVHELLGSEYGDANLDGRVDGLDLEAWENNLFQSGTGWATGDFNGDTITDGKDFNIWNEHKMPSRAESVPEPAAGVLVLLGALTLWHRDRRVRRASR